MKNETPSLVNRVRNMILPNGMCFWGEHLVHNMHYVNSTIPIDSTSQFVENLISTIFSLRTKNTVHANK